jgi:hypothetical protein
MFPPLNFGGGPLQQGPSQQQGPGGPGMPQQQGSFSQQQQQQQQFMAQQQFAQQQQFMAQQQQQQQQLQRVALTGQKRPLNGADGGGHMQQGAPGGMGMPQLHPGAPTDEPKPKRSRQDEIALLSKVRRRWARLFCFFWRAQPSLHTPTLHPRLHPTHSTQPNSPTQPTRPPPRTQNTGTSLLETFDLPQLRAHVDRVREEVTRAAAKAGGGGAAAAAYADPKDVCTVCKQSKFTFEPPCLYCTQCGQRIKRGQTYHCTPAVRCGCGCWLGWIGSCRSGTFELFEAGPNRLNPTASTNRLNQPPQPTALCPRPAGVRDQGLLVPRLLQRPQGGPRALRRFAGPRRPALHLWLCAAAPVIPCAVPPVC